MIFDTLRSAVDLYNHLPRYREILSVLFKYGFADVLRLVALQHILRIEDATIRTHPDDKILSKPLPERLRLALEELGPTFVKFGQILSSRRDLITDDYFIELEKLQSGVPPFPAKEAREIIEKELGYPVRALYSDFREKPIGSASIAQVHQATLKDGTPVAIKVQRPDIEKTISLDVAILHDLARFIEKHVPEAAGLNPTGVVQEFTETLQRELDFENEASNAERFAEQFEGNPHIRVPKIYRDHSTCRVLVMDYITGIPITDADRLRAQGTDPAELAATMTGLIYEQIFEHGFFHGDPHPGNMTILPDSKIVLYDYGMMGKFTPQMRESIALLVSGLGEKNHAQTTRSILDLSEEGIASDQMLLQAEVEKFAEQNLSKPLRDISLGAVLNSLLDLLRDNRLRMKPAFYLGIKALAQVEAIGRALDPELNFILLGEPYATRVLVGKFGAGRVGTILKGVAVELLDFLRDFPGDFRQLYQSIRRGKLNIPLEHKIDPEGFEPLRKTLDSIANRLANAILTASILICSSIVILASLPPHVAHVSVPGAVGLLFGAYMCVRLFLSIWRHGGL
ncbi:MAG: AarF/UbiB family protein [Terrimicrobiaceae bacterium]